MTIPEFKKIARLLKLAYKEIEEEALAHGVDILSEEYEEFFKLVQPNARALILKKQGFTIEEYTAAKEEAKTLQDAERVKPLEDAKAELNDKISKIVIPQKEDIVKIAQEEASKIPPRVTHETRIVKETVREVVKEQPYVIYETKTVREEYDPTELLKKLSLLESSFLELKKPETPEETETFAEKLQENIDILGMPDFRKLAMGLQSQIDDLRSNPSGGSFTLMTPTGDVDGSNNIFTFTSAPSVIVRDGVAITEIAKDGTANWTGTTTVTLLLAPNFDLFGF